MNFARFVDWPAEAFDESGGAIVVGVIADESRARTIDQTMNHQTANGRLLRVKRFALGQDLRACHILFISSSEKRDLPRILAGLRGSSVLTVGEMERFTEQGGIINFVLEGNRVRFEINRPAAEAVRLRISSKLLSVAKLGAAEHR